jgi:hypothetical protein
MNRKITDLCSASDGDINNGVLLIASPDSGLRKIIISQFVKALNFTGLSCRHCGGKFIPDSRGNCGSCGAPRGE